jgi:hypothetical protein
MDPNPYGEGVEAFKARQPRSANPYSYSNGERTSYYLWADGYDAADFATSLRKLTPSGASPFPALTASA